MLHKYSANHAPHSRLHRGPLSSLDDSLVNTLNKSEYDHLRHMTERERSFGDLTRASKGSTMHSAPTSPLKMSWGQGPSSHISTPERVIPRQLYDDDTDHHGLGIAGDVVLSNLSLGPPVGREISSGSSLDGLDLVDPSNAYDQDTSNPMANSYESTGVAATWRSVGDRTPGADEGRSRAVSSDW